VIVGILSVVSSSVMLVGSPDVVGLIVMCGSSAIPSLPLLPLLMSSCHKSYMHTNA
jgi:hypothetical protein